MAVSKNFKKIQVSIFFIKARTISSAFSIMNYTSLFYVSCADF